MSWPGFEPYHTQAINDDMPRAKWYAWSGDLRLVKVDHLGPLGVVHVLLLRAINARQTHRLDALVYVSQVGFSESTAALAYSTARVLKNHCAGFGLAEFQNKERQR